MTTTEDAPAVDVDQLVADNIGLIGFTIRRHYGATHTQDIDDLWQDGYFGLRNAAERFDATRARFSTYAVIWIRQAISRGYEQREGGNYRRQVRLGTRDQYQPPASIDYDADGISLAGILPAPDDPAAAGTAHGFVHELLERCPPRDALDRVILHALATDTYSRKAIAARHGYSPQGVDVRRDRLLARLRDAAAGGVTLAG